jgi:hypothetical protein
MARALVGIVVALATAAPAAAMEAGVSSNAIPFLSFGGRSQLEVRDVRGGTPVVVFADEFPYEGTETEVGRVVADETGSARIPIAPVRNTRYRVVSEATGESDTVDVLTDLRKELRFEGSGFPPVMRAFRLVVSGPPDSVRSLRVKVYRARHQGPLRLMRRARVRRVNRWIAMAIVRLPGSRLGDALVLCLEEGADNGHGPPPSARGDCEMAPPAP